MKQLLVRKIITEKSGNEYFALFEEGHLNSPICLMYEFELKVLKAEIEDALENHNILKGKTK